MHKTTGKSDAAIVPEKQANKTSSGVADLVEERAATKGNTHTDNRSRTQSRNNAMSGLVRVREIANQDPKTQFTALLHHVTVDVLRQSFYQLKRDSAAGVDGVDWRSYKEGLEDRITDLHSRIHTNRYRPRPSRRVYIPKSDGSQRPLSIQCLEDKLTQQALVQVLNQVYEADFLGFSYGFRPGRGAHDALDALSYSITHRKINWVLDLDIRKFFDTVEHEWLMRMLAHRIHDKRVLALVKRWLKVGVIEDGKRHPSTVGTPQGAVISPLLANVYLHYVYDLWAHSWRTNHAKGDVVIVRYADDSVLGFQYVDDAQRFRRALAVRLGRFGLSLHPQKTQLLRFGQFATRDEQSRGASKPKTFDFLGFTHYCKFRRNGSFTVGRRTSRKRLQASIRSITLELRRRLHAPMHETARWLTRVIRGHLNYFAVPGNLECVGQFRYEVIRRWFKLLRRRSQRHRLTWATFAQRANSWFPVVRTLHEYPQKRFLVKHPR